MSIQLDRINERTVQIGKALFAQIHNERETVTTMNKWTREIINWCMANHDVKARVLRFVDVLPTLKTDRAITEHIRAYFSPSESRLPLALRSGAAITKTPFTGRAIASITHHMTIDVAKQFICGETVEAALKNLSPLEAQGMTYSLDILGEAVVSRSEADRYQNSVIDLIDKLPFERNISIKLSALTAHFDSLCFEKTSSEVLARLLPIVLKAQQKNIFIYIDAEQYVHRDLSLAITKNLILSPELKKEPLVGIVFQAYLKDTEITLQQFVNFLKEHKIKMGVRLVKGAYWDSEVAHAKANNWPIPVFEEKSSTDANFENLTQMLIENNDVIQLAIGSHNIRSIAHAMALDEEKQVEFQLLYGMADPLKKALLEQGRKVRVYAPYGPLIPGMAYLVRRILENTSNESFLKLDLAHEADENELLRTPQMSPPTKNGSHSLRFQNEPLLDFSKENIRNKFQMTLDSVSKKCGEKYRLTIGGKKIETTNSSPSVNPTHPEKIIGTISKAEWKDAELAIQLARETQVKWSNRPAVQRADCLFRAASIMRELRMELAAWEILEAGKTWREADADVTEAIDFLEYYGRSLIEIASENLLPSVPGEKNRTLNSGRGVVAVIAPWNFPLAILTGMTAAALVTGNAVVVKPAEPTRVLGSLLIDILIEAGIPESIIAYLPGSGAEIGNGLVRHPQIDMVAFTGSKDVGLSIIQKAAMTTPEQFNIKKVIAELGGKNAIIVDDDADFDEAILGVIPSAFGYQGQKCSACSRLILLESIYDTFLSRLIDATQSLKVGDPCEPDTDVGPIISLDAFMRIKGLIEEGKSEARLLYEGIIPPHLKNGYFIPPTIFSEAPLNGTLAQTEVFGPVLTVFRVQDFNDALYVANNTAFGLTAGLYSRNPKHIAQATAQIEAGNIYINRKITGAMVSRQPFGGFRMSGTGPKAGGKEYLFHFMHQKTISENTFRHGFPL